MGATVTGEDCSITVTKTAAGDDVCDGASVPTPSRSPTRATRFSWTGTITDDVLGPLTPDPVTIGPGESITLHPAGVIGGEVTNTVTATGAFGDPDSTSADASSESVTVTSRVCATPEPTEGVAVATPPAPTPEATDSVAVETPRPETGPAPIIIAKVNTKGTNGLSDDRLLPNAEFEMRLDDGDGRYEPDEDQVVHQAVATRGFLVLRSPPEGDYWVVEVDAPSGFELAKPMLARYPTDVVAGNCIQYGEIQRCLPDDDASGGILLVVVPDAPVEDLPRTDSDTAMVIDIPRQPVAVRGRRPGARGSPGRSRPDGRLARNPAHGLTMGSRRRRSLTTAPRVV